MKRLLSLLFLVHALIIQAQTSASFSEGKKAFDQKEFQKAVKLFNEVEKTAPSNIEAVFWRGLAKAQLKDYQGAIKDFTKVLDSIPTHTGALVNRGTLYSLVKDYPKALNDYSTAEKIAPADKSIYVNRGLLYYSMKEYDLAKKDFTLAIALSPEDKELYHYRSDCYNFTGTLDSAQIDLEAILKIDNSDVHAKTNLAFCYVTQKEFAKANDLYSQLIISESKNPYILNNYGYVKYHMGNTSEGLKMIQESLTIMPDNSYAYKYLAEIYLAENRTKEACSAIAKGLKLGFTKNYGPEMDNLQKKYCK